MHIFFAGIGGTGIGPLAVISKQAGYEVSGSDKQDSQYIHNVREHGIDVHIGQSEASIAKVHRIRPIDWFVYSSALPKENPHHPELEFCKAHGIKTSTRDELINKILSEKDLKLIAIAGTHGKTTTTAMVVWLFKSLGIPVSYSVGAKSGFADMGAFEAGSRYFVYECDEYERNFLSFHPHISLISGVDWDHPDTYPTREAYNQAFRDFLTQSEWATLWHDDADRLGLSVSEDRLVWDANNTYLKEVLLAGEVNRRDAWLAVASLERLGLGSHDQLIRAVNNFPGVSRRFEKLAENLYTDYAHTPPKIRGALQLACESAGRRNNARASTDHPQPLRNLSEGPDQSPNAPCPVVVIYEGLHNTRQHFIKDELGNLFAGIKKLYVVPSYLAREDKSLELLSPKDLVGLMDLPADRQPAELDDELWQQILHHRETGSLVLAISAGGGGSLDEWLRRRLSQE